jgi:UPF0716 protein FxsA
MFLAPLLLFLLWPIAELYVIVRVAEAIGVLDTILLLVASWPIGSWAIRSQGRAAWRRLAAAAAAGRAPTREVVDGALILLGGGLMMVPGFITDAFGLLLLLPPTRALTRTLLVRNFESRFVVLAMRFGGRPGRPADVDSTAVDVDRPQLRP